MWIAENGEFTEFACTGLDDERRTVGEYLMELEDLVTRNVLMHCLNPDRIVVRGGETEPCAGALADLYIDLGGRVEWYGKPFPAIYRHALKLAGSPSIEEVIAVGDALQTDILGAARMGFDAVFVAGGSTLARASLQSSLKGTAWATGIRWRSSTPFAKAQQCNSCRLHRTAT
ncbi:TIGR01459 family HAD-type hydrolase [Sphingomonas daechungensis]|uniref:TIGR01459 family HAD-type hydrolase n=1 Tax=Sphingomonas daechungensis TaxID=1176646 RepID=A0ABX6SYT6_9SPHN|nr:TIGR01459 family HAD-type hydrolase [Sphingomonas daechungensis]